jgi:GDP-D-mannose dehydratase
MTLVDKLFAVDAEVVVITGIAGQLGFQYAQVFLDRGARVAGLDVASSARTDQIRIFLVRRDTY